MEKGTLDGDTFYEATTNNFSSPTTGGVLNYDIKISRAGIYRFHLRSRINIGTDNHEHNDTWVKLPNSSTEDFFGYRGSATNESGLNAALASNTGVLFPKGSGKTPPPNGGSTSGFLKAYMGILNAWSWGIVTNDGPQHQIYAKFSKPGVYRLQMSNRSQGHAIEKIALHHVGTYGINYSSANLTNAAESPREGGGSQPQPTNQSPNANAGADQTLTVGTNGQAAFTLNGSQSSDPDGSITAYLWKQGTTTVGTQAQLNLTRSPGTYTFTLEVTDNKGAKDTDQVTVTVQSASTPPPPPPTGDLAVTSLTLINASTDQDIKNLVNQDQINIAQVGSSLSVRANVNKAVGSVKFELNGQLVKIEGAAPYALNGNNGSDYTAANLPVGNHTLKATPYAGSGATGTVGQALTITFSIINQVNNPNPPPPPPTGNLAVTSLTLINASTDQDIKN
ncbi:MAG: hypothetical protein HC880_22140, partial [Bacteroidia bacterium]|nr:hypothetical protein [Bacteroidia bacterium]